MITRTEALKTGTSSSTANTRSCSSSANDQTEPHTATDAGMLATFRDMIERFDQFGTGAIAAFVEHWIAGHLFAEDMAPARFIQRNQKTGASARKVA